MARKWNGLAALTVLVFWAGAATAQDGMGMMRPGTGRSQPAGRDGWEGGAAYYLLGTYGGNNEAFATTVVAPGTRAVTDTSFPTDYTSGAAFWLGKTWSSGVGLQVRYFFHVETPAALAGTPTPAVGTVTTVTPPAALTFAAGATFTSPGVLMSLGIGADAMSAQRSLNIHAIDVEGTFRQSLGQWAVVATGGGRFMYLGQDYTAQLTNTVAPGVLSESQVLGFTRRFNGGGPTVSICLQAPILGSALFGYASVRGSVLAGGQRDDLTFNQTVVDVGGVTARGSFTDTNSSSNFHATVIPVGELEVGLQLGQTIEGFPVMIRGGVVSQTYFNAGTSSDPNSNLHLLGVQLSLTLSF